mmetsp:Transcript_22430/g.69570  ORF Transcript_22430/g.69570 Transcript_22430/m.69570 type:complete len:316 (-) Transcript_22430:1122-2069(-)
MRSCDGSSITSYSATTLRWRHFFMIAISRSSCCRARSRATDSGAPAKEPTREEPRGRATPSGPGSAGLRRGRRMTLTARSSLASESMARNTSPWAPCPSVWSSTYWLSSPSVKPSSTSAAVAVCGTAAAADVGEATSSSSAPMTGDRSIVDIAVVPSELPRTSSCGCVAALGSISESSASDVADRIQRSSWSERDVAFCSELRPALIWTAAAAAAAEVLPSDVVRRVRWRARSRCAAKAAVVIAALGDPARLLASTERRLVARRHRTTLPAGRLMRAPGEVTDASASGGDMTADGALDGPICGVARTCKATNGDS